MLLAMVPRAVVPLLVALATLLLAGTARAAPPLPAQVQMGVFSPGGQAATDRAHGFALRTYYVTGGIGHWAAQDERSWLDETAQAGQLPIVTYYQLHPSERRGAPGLDRIRHALPDRSLMPSYWRDARKALQVIGQRRDQRVIFHVEPDGWEFMEQLGGVRTRAIVGSSGMRELRGLPDDVRGFARAFVRLRDRYAPNAELAFHASSWGVGQNGVPSLENSERVATLRARFIRALGARFDAVLTDPSWDRWDDRSFAEHLAFVGTLHRRTGLPVTLFQMPTDDRVSWLLGPDATAQAHLAAERAAGVVGVLWDAGTPDDPSDGRATLFGMAQAAAAAGRLG